MPSPFPGMDPYLENPELWRDVHTKLISEIQTALNPLLRPRYVARLEKRVYLSDEDDLGREWIVPDLRLERRPKRGNGHKPRPAAAARVVEPMIVSVITEEEIEEAYLSIQHLETKSLVAVVEILSPSNKIRGSRGRTNFMDKRREIMASRVHWIEIDLLRAGEPSVTRPSLQPCDYRLLVSRGNDRDRARGWPVSVRQSFPVIGIPLKGKDPDVPLDLGTVLNVAYDAASYDLSIDYRKPPVPPLNPDDAKWANALLREKGLR